MEHLYTKEEVLNMILSKLNGDSEISYDRIAEISGYSKRQILRFKDKLLEKDIDSILTHGNKGLVPVNKANETELNFYREYKKQYPKITIAQFKDFIDEDVLTNDELIKEHNIVKRSISFFQRLFKKEGWVSPVKHKVKGSSKKIHPLRERMPRRGMLVQIDGTPHKWFESDSSNHCLHLAVDDATGEVLAGFFTNNECLYGYLKLLVLILKNYGVPKAFYSDRSSSLKSLNTGDKNTSIFSLFMEKLGIEQIFALSAEAKGRIERYNGTIQNRLINDIKRFKIKDYDELNEWFESFYRHYLNNKLSISPIDPNDEFIPMKDDFNYDKFFTVEVTRTVQNGAYISYKGQYYVAIDENGEVVPIIKGTKVYLCFEILNKKVYLKRSGRYYDIESVGTYNNTKEAADSKSLLNSYNNNDDNMF